MSERHARLRGQLYVLTIAVAAFLAGACDGVTAPSVGGEATRSETADVSTAPAEKPSASAKSTRPGAATEVDPCRLLKAAELRELPGTRFVTPTLGDFQGIPQCRWEAAGGIVFQVQAAPSADWGATVGAVMEQLATSPNISADDAKELEQAQRELSKRGELSARQACAVFSLMAEVGGHPEGATETVSYVPVGDDSVAVTAQKCTDGRFTSVAFHKPGLQELPEITRAMRAALLAAHGRAVTAVR